MKLPNVSGQEIVKVLLNGGFAVVGQRGSHIKVRKVTSAGKITVIIPNHKEVKQGTLRAILKQAGIPPKRFAEIL